MTKVIKLDIEKLRSFKPCYDPETVLPKGWTGTLYELLGNENIPAKDRIWVATRQGLLDDRTLRLFAVACARRVRKFVTDKKTFDSVLRVATRYANGKATSEELAGAFSAAYAAAASATTYAAYAASATTTTYAASAAAYAASATASAYIIYDARKGEREAQVEILRNYLRTGSFSGRKKK